MKYSNKQKIKKNASHSHKFAVRDGSCNRISESAYANGHISYEIARHGLSGRRQQLNARCQTNQIQAGAHEGVGALQQEAQPARVSAHHVHIGGAHQANRNTRLHRCDHKQRRQVQTFDKGRPERRGAQEEHRAHLCDNVPESSGLGGRFQKGQASKCERWLCQEQGHLGNAHQELLQRHSQSCRRQTKFVCQFQTRFSPRQARTSQNTRASK